jgi:hypothetical protein
MLKITTGLKLIAMLQKNRATKMRMGENQREKASSHRIHGDDISTIDAAESTDHQIN